VRHAGVGRTAAIEAITGRRPAGTPDAVAHSMPQRDPGREPRLQHRLKEDTMSAIVAAVLFAIALLLHVSGQALGPLDTTFFMLAGLLAAALHLAGIGSSRPARVRR
jgi:hypothetical protein